MFLDGSSSQALGGGMYCCRACFTHCVQGIGRDQVFPDVLVLPSLVLLAQTGTTHWDGAERGTVG